MLNCESQPPPTIVEKGKPPKEMPSEVFKGRFRILERIGKGGFGKIYLVYDTLKLKQYIAKIVCLFPIQFDILFIAISQRAILD